MTKHATLREVGQYGTGAAYLANVILWHHRNPARKLRGLLRLLRAGKSCRVGQFNLDVLLVDGERQDWSILETQP